MYRFEPAHNELNFVFINNNFRIHNCYSLNGVGGISLQTKTDSTDTQY